MQPEFAGFINFGIFFFVFFLIVAVFTYVSLLLNKVEGRTGSQILKSLFIGLGTALSVVGIQSLTRRLGVGDDLNRTMSFILAGVINLCLIYILFQTTWKKAIWIWLLPLVVIVVGLIYLKFR